MLTITIPGIEMYDEKSNEFITTKECTLQLEHSLVSLSKWEAKWGKPFLTKDKKTAEETIDYIRCMTINKGVDDIVYSGLTNDQLTTVGNYIHAPMTATTFRKEDSKRNSEIMTSEVIYYYMIALTIPIECQKWHLNRLLTLIRVCNTKNSPPKKMSQSDLLARNRALNESRRKANNSKG